MFWNYKYFNFLYMIVTFKLSPSSISFEWNIFIILNFSISPFSVACRDFDDRFIVIAVFHFSCSFALFSLRKQ